MKLNDRRQWSARVLLAVLLPMLVLSSLHVHDYGYAVGNECEECVHHVHHSGHFTAQTGTLHECVLCQMLSLQYLPMVAVVLIAQTCKINTQPQPRKENVCAGARGIDRLRAPPVCLYI